MTTSTQFEDGPIVDSRQESVLEVVDHEVDVQKDIVRVPIASSNASGSGMVATKDDTQSFSAATTLGDAKDSSVGPIITDSSESITADISGMNNTSSSSSSKMGSTIGLSKFLLRLLERDRFKLVHEPPQVIPLNDEYLRAFGQREKETDRALNRTIDIVSQIDDDDENDNHTDINLQNNESSSIKVSHSEVDENLQDDNGRNSDIIPIATAFVTDTKATSTESNSSTTHSQNQPPKQQALSPLPSRKVKLANILYTTSAIAITNACSLYGDVIDVNLPLSDGGSGGEDTPNNSNIDSGTKRNIGVAYVTFETSHAAQECIQKLGTIDNRKIYATLVHTPHTHSASKRENTSRYYGTASPHSHSNAISKTITDAQLQQKLRLLSLKCYNCGQPGHMSSDCPNPTKNKPCALCAGTDGHISYKCIYSMFCFHCGLPGHASMKCPHKVQQQQFAAAASNQKEGMTIRKTSSSSGHIQPLPVRRICSYCYEIGHTKFHCPTHRRRQLEQHHQQKQLQNHNDNYNFRGYNRNSMMTSQIPNEPSIVNGAICMICGEIGHYLCNDLQLNNHEDSDQDMDSETIINNSRDNNDSSIRSSGGTTDRSVSKRTNTTKLKCTVHVTSVSCFNCGRYGHIGANCDRPNVDACSRDEELLLREIELSGTYNSESSAVESLGRQSLSVSKTRYIDRQRTNMNYDKYEVEDDNDPMRSVYNVSDLLEINDNYKESCKQTHRGRAQVRPTDGLHNDWEKQSKRRLAGVNSMPPPPKYNRRPTGMMTNNTYEQQNNIYQSQHQQINRGTTPYDYAYTYTSEREYNASYGNGMSMRPPPPFPRMPPPPSPRMPPPPPPPRRVPPPPAVTHRNSTSYNQGHNSLHHSMGRNYDDDDVVFVGVRHENSTSSRNNKRKNHVDGKDVSNSPFQKKRRFNNNELEGQQQQQHHQHGTLGSLKAPRQQRPRPSGFTK